MDYHIWDAAINGGASITGEVRAARYGTSGTNVSYDISTDVLSQWGSGGAGTPGPAWTYFKTGGANTGLKIQDNGSGSTNILFKWGTDGLTNFTANLTIRISVKIIA